METSTENKTEVRPVRKKLTLTVMLGIIMIVIIALTGIYGPRLLSSYLDIDNDKVDAVYLEYLSKEDRDSWYQKVYLDESKIDSFMRSAKKIAVVPKSSPLKTTPSYRFNVVSGNKIYDFCYFSLCVRENGNVAKSHNYQIISGDDKHLLDFFDVDESDIR